MKTKQLMLSGILLLLLAGSVLAEPVNGKTYDHWTVRCEPVAEQSKQPRCYVFQNLIMKQGGSRVLHISAGLHPKNKERVVILITMPLGISLPPGASIQVDDNKPIKFLIERCDPEGCRGSFMLSEFIKKQFETGKTATVTFHDANRKPIDVSVSLNGFSEGVVALN